MKILMIYPESPDTFWSYREALKFIRRKASNPPLGLLTIAAMLPSEWDISLVDMNVRPLRDRQIAKADYVWLSAMTVQKQSAREVISRCKAHGKPIVAGGPLFSTGWSDFPEVDTFICGEGEETIHEYIEDMKQGRVKHRYEASGWADLTKSPIPRWDLIRMHDYASMPIQYSRGCPYSCDFCDITLLFGRKVRTKAAEQIIEELEALYSHGWRDGVFFVDDNFIIHTPHLKKELLPSITQWMDTHQHPFIFNTQASINMSDDPDLMAMMVQAGFSKVFVGIETPNEASLGECSKNHNLNRNLLDSVAKIINAGFEVQGGFILGFDSDPKSIFDDLIEFIQRSSIITAMVGLLNAMKGTELYLRLKREHRLLDVESGDNTDCSINFLTRMDKAQLLAGYKRVIATIYSPAYYYGRVKEFLRSYTPKHTRSFKFHPVHVLSFVASILLIGIRGKERLHYWKLLFWTIFRRPKLFPMAVTYSIYGYHYRKTAERIMHTELQV